jgi:catechol 2,3-dioxygenase-like lactoylglutathione lyase family enzyme
MKRMHVMLKVTDLQASVDFYTALFGDAPTVRKPDYAKWLLDDPRVNFSLAQQPGTPGIEHLGIQVEEASELRALYTNLARAKTAVREEGHTTCCYAQSEKAWATDPQGVAWEVFHTYGAHPAFYGEDDACCSDACCSDEDACCGERAA